MRYKMKKRSIFIAIALWVVPTTFIAISGTMRATGMTTAYARLCHITGGGNIEFLQRLEPGTSPGNKLLPPHLRLDQRSYLDMPRIELAVPPLFSLTFDERAVGRGDIVLPDSQRYTFSQSFLGRASTVVVPESQVHYATQRKLGNTGPGTPTSAPTS